MASAADGGSRWSSAERPGDGTPYETDEGAVVPTHDHDQDTHASPEVSEDMTEAAQREREPMPEEESEANSSLIGFQYRIEVAGPTPDGSADHYETDEGPVVATRDHEADTHADPDELDE